MPKVQKKLDKKDCPEGVMAAINAVKGGAFICDAIKRYGVSEWNYYKWVDVFGVVTRNKRFHSEELIADVLNELQEGKLSVAELSKKRGIHNQTVRLWVRKSGITNYKKNTKYNMSEEKRQRLIERAHELRLAGLYLCDITAILHKEIGQVHISTVSKWIKGINCEFPWRRDLLTGWKRSKALDKYIKEIQCSLQAKA